VRRSVEGPGGPLVVESGGRVDRGAGEQEIQLGLAGGPSSVVGEAVDDIFEDQAVVRDKEVGDGAGCCGEGGKGTVVRTLAGIEFDERYLLD